MELSDHTSVLPSSAIPEAEPLRLVAAVGQGKRKFSETFKYGQLRLRKRADSGLWQVIYRHPRTGEVTERSLGTTLKKEALTQATQLSAQLTNNKAGVADGSASIKMLFEEYFRAIKGRKAPETLKRIASSRHVFERWLGQSRPEARLIRNVTPGVVREFQDQRVDEQGVAKRTVDNDVKNMHTVFRWGVREGLVSKSPFDYSKYGTVQLYDEPQPEPDTYSDEEYERLVKEAERVGDLLIWDMIVVFADTGMRYGELANLVPEALRWDTDPPHIDIRARNGWKPKDPKERKRIPMSKPVAVVLRRRTAVSNGGLLFPDDEGNVFDGRRALERLQVLFSAAGITPGRRLHWHSWRNHFVRRCLDAGVAIHQLMPWTGHDSIEMALHYATARTGDSEAFAPFSKLPPRGKFGAIALNPSKNPVNKG